MQDQFILIGGPEGRQQAHAKSINLHSGSHEHPYTLTVLHTA